MPRKQTEFQTIYSEGGLLPSDLLRRILDSKGAVSGTKPEDYGLPQGEHIGDMITQSWNRLRRHWAEFRLATQALQQGEAATGLTNDKWSLPLLRELGFGLLPVVAGPVVDGKTYAIGRFAGKTPIHLVGCGMSLDKRVEGVRGAARSSPHGLVQEFLNRAPGHLWAIVSNGLHFRILRDNQALSRQSYLEFDLEIMFDGEVFSDFVLLWLIAHATRFVDQQTGHPESCWLEQWTKFAEEQGTRALESLQGGVEKALQVLGQGFVGHPRNAVLREAIRSGSLSLSDLHNQLLRIIYRLIFLFVAEDRTLDGASLIHPYNRTEKGRQSRELYATHYSMARMRELAASIRGSRHGDLWQQFNMLVGALVGEERLAAARDQLALPILGSFLWSPDSTKSFNASSLTGSEGVELSNADFLEAIRNLAFTRQGNILRHVDYKNLGAEELGGVYESLLSLTPQVSSDGAKFTFAEFAGNERKTSGSYYTPDSLVQCLLDSALDPVVKDAIKGKSGLEAEKALLSLKICDPAVGSGHFLVGAAHRLARYLSRIRAQSEGESEPSPIHYQKALRDVINRCLYGVDINHMSAELCRVGLWLEALEPGKPLSFLDHHIRVGNSLLGTTPRLLKEGIPDSAFEPIEGDDKNFCQEYKKRNKEERQGQETLFDATLKPWEQLGNLATAMVNLEAIDDDTIEGIQAKQRKYEEFVKSNGYLFGRFLADAWCAAFVWKKMKSNDLPYPITEEIFRNIEKNPHAAPHWIKEEVQRLANQYQFFHWNIMFPDVFRVPKNNENPENEQMGWSGGFDVVLGNPPWEHTELKEREWFSNRLPEIANETSSTKRKRMILKLEEKEPSLFREFILDKRKHTSISQFILRTELYPLCGRGRINTYSIFSELGMNISNLKGHCGVIVPTGIATDDTNKYFFQELTINNHLVSLFDFENRKGLFPGVHRMYKFCLLTFIGSQKQNSDVNYAFYCQDTSDLLNEDVKFVLSTKEIFLLNPNTRTCPIFRNRRIFNINLKLYEKTQVLNNHNIKNGNPWGLEISRMFNASDDSAFFETVAQDNMVRIYEAKCFWQYDHRYSSYINNEYKYLSSKNKQELSCQINTEFYFNESTVPRKFVKKIEPYYLSYRVISNATNERTMVACILPHCGLLNSANNFYGPKGGDAVLLLANMNSFCLDFAVRQAMGGSNLHSYIVYQLPVFNKTVYNNACLFDQNTNIAQWIKKRVLELQYTASDLKAFANDCGYEDMPFIWDEDRRFLLKCELDAVYFWLYGVDRDDVSFIMETFPIVKRRDEELYDEYRTKRVILEIYDEMSEAMRTGKSYQTRLDPPPADLRATHPSRKTQEVIK